MPLHSYTPAGKWSWGALKFLQSRARRVIDELLSWPRMPLSTLPLPSLSSEGSVVTDHCLFLYILTVFPRFFFLLEAENWCPNCQEQSQLERTFTGFLPVKIYHSKTFAGIHFSWTSEDLNTEQQVAAGKK